MVPTSTGISIVDSGPKSTAELQRTNKTTSAVTVLSQLLSWRLLVYQPFQKERSTAYWNNMILFQFITLLDKNENFYGYKGNIVDTPRNFMTHLFEISYHDDGDDDLTVPVISLWDSVYCYGKCAAFTVTMQEYVVVVRFHYKISYLARCRKNIRSNFRLKLCLWQRWSPPTQFSLLQVTRRSPKGNRKRKGIVNLIWALNYQMVWKYSSSHSVIHGWSLISLSFWHLALFNLDCLTLTFQESNKTTWATSVSKMPLKNHENLSGYTFITWNPYRVYHLTMVSMCCLDHWFG